MNARRVNSRIVTDRDARSTSSPSPGTLIERLAVYFERRIHRWHLLNSASERRHGGHQTLLGHMICRRFRYDLAIRICRVRADTQNKGAEVALVSVQQKLRKLGGLAETER